MQKRLEIGSHVFIIESNRIITEVVVTANHGDFCVLRFPSGGQFSLEKAGCLHQRKMQKCSFQRKNRYRVVSIALHIIMIIDWRRRW